MIFAHLQVTGGVLQSLQVGTFQEVRACGGSENLGDGMGLVVGPDRVGRGLLQDCQGRLGTQVAAHLALPNHQLQPLHRQRAGTEHCQAGTAGEESPRSGSMAVQHLQHCQHCQ